MKLGVFLGNSRLTGGEIEIAKMKAQLQRRCGAKGCSAELNSAVSQVCNLRGAGQFGRCLSWPPSAECNSAIRQIENLRYVFGASGCHALLHFQSLAERQNPAFTGLFIT